MKNFFQKKIESVKDLFFCSSGFTLIEMMVAVSIFSLSIIVLLSLLGTGVANVNYAQDKLTASFLAQEGSESMRNMRNNYVLYGGSSGWTNFTAKLAPCTSVNPCGFDNRFLTTSPYFIFSCSADCKLYGKDGGYNSDPAGTSSPFTRKIWMTSSDVDEAEVYSSVEWNHKGTAFSVTLSENLFNWVE